MDYEFPDAATIIQPSSSRDRDNAYTYLIGLENTHQGVWIPIIGTFKQTLAQRELAKAQGA